MLAQRVYSTKTRIKTEPPAEVGSSHQGLREYIPLKQGLRQNCRGFYAILSLREYIPLKQGLR